jgi:S-adenosylmethionine hydrolase
MARKSAGADPIITLLSDFGLRDSYVAEMKLALLRHVPRATLIDVTHEIAPQDVLGASFQLARAIAAADAGTYHLAVVDPGVGSTRRILVVRLARQTIICPDNGLITWPFLRAGQAAFYELLLRQRNASNTFHGRDIMAPALGMLAAGTTVSKITQFISDPKLLTMNFANPAERRGQIIHIDHFGNATTNIRLVEGHATVRIRRRNIGPIRRTYSDVQSGEALALIGSAGLLEIAMRNGSAAKALRLKVGDEVKLVP